MNNYQIISPNPEFTEQIGFKIGANCSGGEIIGLNGPLGSGKTVFARGLAYALNIRNYIHSPSYTLINEYPGRLWLYHMDFYRLNHPTELMELGLSEYYLKNGVIIIEWSNKYPLELPDYRLEIEFQIKSDEERLLLFHPQKNCKLNIIF